MKRLDEDLENVEGGMAKFLESSSVVKVGVTDLTGTGWESEAQEVANTCISKGFNGSQASLLKSRVLAALNNAGGKAHTVRVEFSSGLAKGIQVFKVYIE